MALAHDQVAIEIWAPIFTRFTCCCPFTSRADHTVGVTTARGAALPGGQIEVQWSTLIALLANDVRQTGALAGHTITDSRRR
jgi:hypothetical protein